MAEKHTEVNDSEQFGQMRQKFLKAVYDLSAGSPARLVRGEDVGQQLGLSLHSDFDEFHRLAQYHRQKGNVLLREGLYGSLNITAKGIQEVERYMPQESRSEKRGQFLRLVYDLTNGDPSQLAEWEDIAPKFGRDAENHEHLEEAVGIARYLADLGFLTLYGDGSRYVITATGIDEVERSVEEEHISRRNQEQQRFLRAIYSLSDGNPAEFVYWRDIAAEMGWNADDEEHHRRSLAIAERLRQGRYITIEVDEGDIYRITARGMDQVEEREQKIAPSIVRRPIEPPPQIQDSLRSFQAEYTNPDKVAFIMMEFGQTPAHEMIVEGIRAGLGRYGIVGVRADERDYHDELFSNVLTYIYGCGLGVAVFDRIEANTHNPNVALEVGYLLAMGKHVCLLKDRTLPTLQADFVGRLYKEFDPQNPGETIPPVLSRWLSDRGLG